MATLAKKDKGFLIWEFVQARGGSKSAIEWARNYGTDLRKAWAECERGEFMVSLATNLQVPFGCVVQATLECIEATTKVLEPDMVPDAVGDLLRVCERLSVEGGDLVNLKGSMVPLQELVNDYRSRNEIGHPGHRVCEAALCVGSAYMNLPLNVSLAHQHLSMALQAAAYARADRVRMDGAPREFCSYVFNQALQEFAGRVRKFITYEVLVTGPMKTAFIHRAIQLGQEIEDVGVC